MRQEPILFADFMAGTEIGRLTETVSLAQAENWAALYPWDPPVDGYAPAGMATVLMMKAFLGIVTPRPPGNLHVQQRMRVHNAIAVGEAIVSSIVCQTKEVRKGRRVIELLATGKDAQGRLLFEGLITLYWAA